MSLDFPGKSKAKACFATAPQHSWRIDIPHVMLAIAPDGAGLVRSNIGPAELGDMAELLAEIADGAAVRRPDDEALN